MGQGDLNGKVTEKEFLIRFDDKVKPFGASTELMGFVIKLVMFIDC